MGFGLLFFGYIFLCNFGIMSIGTNMAFDFFPDVIGWVIMLVGLIKLSPYARVLKGAAATAAVMIPISLYSLLYNFLVLGFLGTASDKIYTAVVYISIAALPVFCFFMSKGVREILLSCNNLEKPARILNISFVITAVYSALALANEINTVLHFVESQKALAILNSVIQILNAAWLLMGAYALLKAFFSVTLTDNK